VGIWRLAVILMGFWYDWSIGWHWDCASVSSVAFLDDERKVRGSICRYEEGMGESVRSCTSV